MVRRHKVGKKGKYNLSDGIDSPGNVSDGTLIIRKLVQNEGLSICIFTYK